MSGIFGLLRFDGQPVDAQDLEKMRAGLAHWGPDGSALWSDGPVGLGHLLLRNTPESIHESSPVHNTAGGLVLTATARLDNRAELFQALDIREPERAALPDVALILQAYERWGEECVQRLLGDWAFAVWDARRRSLFLARDHHGLTGLFYYRGQRFFAFASSLAGLLALPQVPRRPNALRVAHILVAWPKHGPATAYEELYRLPPAHCLTVSAGLASPRRYWSLEDTPDLRLGSDADYVERFLELYAEAVRCRLRSLRPVGATVSGGLDSSSVSALAARELGRRGERFPTYTSVPIYDTSQSVSRRFGDESGLVEALARHSGAIETNFVRANHFSPLAGLRRALELQQEPAHASGNAYWIAAILEAARARGLGAILIGQNGNAVVSWAGALGSPWPFLQRRQWADFQSAAAASLKAGPLWQAIRRQIVAPLRRSVLAGYFYPSAWRQSAINPALAARLRLGQRLADDADKLPYTSADAAVLERYRLLQPGGSILGSLWADWGAGYALEVRDPTIDKRLLEFCLAIPDDQYRRGEHDRWLIRRAMAGWLPDEVRLNTRRGRQAADLIQRVRASSAEIEAALESLEDSAPARDYLNLPLMRQTLAAADRSIDRETLTGVVTVLLRGLSAGLFLLTADTG